jgi:hypothetical protein
MVSELGNHYTQDLKVPPAHLQGNGMDHLYYPDTFLELCR